MFGFMTYIENDGGIIGGYLLTDLPPDFVPHSELEFR